MFQQWKVRVKISPFSGRWRSRETLRTEDANEKMREWDDRSGKWKEWKGPNVKQRKTGIVQENSGISNRALEQERTLTKSGKPWSFANLFFFFLPYQAGPDMGENHVPAMRCGCCPFSWKVPLTYQLIGRLPVPVALQLWCSERFWCWAQQTEKHINICTNRHACLRLNNQQSKVKFM